MPRVTLMLGREELQVYNLPQECIRIGRSSKANIVLDNVMISREHAEIRRVGTSYLIANLAGKNGVFVNGRWVDTLMLNHGDLIEVGKYTLRFEYPDDERAKVEGLASKREGAAYRITTTEMMAAIAADEEEVPGPRRRSKFAAPDSAVETMLLAPAELQKVRESMAAVRKAHLEQRVGANKQIHHLEDERVTVGKGADATIRVDAGWLAPKTSAALQRVGGGHLLEVLGGSVKVNGEKVTGSRDLRDGDQIDVEGAVFVYRAAVRG